MLMGTRPEPAGTFSRFISYGQVRRTRLALLGRGIDPAVAQLVSRMMAPHPALRPESAAAIGNMFAQVSESPAT
jgi:hypothetical protein